MQTNDKKEHEHRKGDEEENEKREEGEQARGAAKL